ncbi:helix-turn-helix domain-containing protein [Actinomadura syzygii]|nr:helix-turn-helix transcriptional regulator [Actinomadura syzygii]
MSVGLAPVDPTRARTLPELMAMLDELRRRAGLSLRQLVSRSRQDADGSVLARTTVSEFFQGARAPRARDLLRIVELCGGTSSDLQRWATACDRLVDPTDAYGTVIRASPPAEGTFGQPAEHYPPGGSMVPRLLLGARLRALREARGILPEHAGYAIRASHSKISRIELGRVRFKERDVADLLTLYGVIDPSERAPLLELARQTNAPSWWQRYGDVVPGWYEAYLGMEEAASSLRTYELQLVPSLLQTGDYARAVIRLRHPFASEEEVERRVQVRAIRQRRVAFEEPFTGGDRPKLWAVLDEAILHRPFRDRTMMRAQIQHLIEMADSPGVGLRILPLGAGGYPAAGSFTLLRFDDPDLPEVVYLEQIASANYLDRPDDVELYTRVWDECTAASRPDKTTQLLRRLLRDI